MRKATMILPAALLLLAGCGAATLSTGRSVEAELPPVESSLESVLPGAEELLLLSGYPVDGSWRAVSYDLGTGTALSISAGAEEMRPVLVVTDGAGGVLTAADGFQGDSDAWVAVADPPEGARLLAFGMDDARGSFSLRVDEASAEDIREYGETSGITPGSRLVGYIDPSRYSRRVHWQLTDDMGEWVYSGEKGLARIYPLHLDEGGLLDLTLTSEVFDPVLVLARVDTFAMSYQYVSYSDDYGEGLDSHLAEVVDAGNYVAIVMPYGEDARGSFVLDMDLVPESDMGLETVEVWDLGSPYRGSVVQGENLAIAAWPDMLEYGTYESTLEPATPTAPFAMRVEDTALYSFTASSDADVCLTLLRVEAEDGWRELIGYNDDAPGLGTDSRLSALLTPGYYYALVSLYYEEEEAVVTLTAGREEMEMPELTPGRSVEVDITFDEPSSYLSFETEPGYDYVVTAEDDELDPVLEVFMPDGTSLYDDDSGGDLNSMLTISPYEGQLGTCYVEVSSYWGDSEGSITVGLERELVLRP